MSRASSFPQHCMSYRHSVGGSPLERGCHLIIFYSINRHKRVVMTQGDSVSS